MLTTELSAAQKAAITRKANAAARAAGEKPKRAKRQVERLSILSVAAPAAELTAGQKAALTRRAREEAREKIAAVKTGVAAEAAVDSKVVEVWLDDAQIGCGWRRYVVLDVSAKWVRLFNAPRLTAIRVDRVTFDRQSRAAKFKAKKVAEIIRNNINAAERINDESKAVVVPDGGRDARQALEILEA